MILASATALVLSLQVASAQIWPEKWQLHKRVSAEPVAVEDSALFQEYGGAVAEKAVYSGLAGKFSATAWRLNDSTGAYAWYLATRPENGVPVRGSQGLAVTTPGSQFLIHQNYVLKFEGWRPQEGELKELYNALPERRSGGGLPKFVQFIPASRRVRNSERYLLGLTSLERFAKIIPATAAGFEHNVEGLIARYTVPGGDSATALTMAVLAYPTHQMARQHEAEFARLPGWVVHRDGPLVALVPPPAPAEAASALTQSVKQEFVLTVSEPTKPLPIPNVGGMLVAIFELTGLLLVACVGGGLAFAGLALWMRRRRARSGEGDAMLTLNLEDRKEPFESLR